MRQSKRLLLFLVSTALGVGGVLWYCLSTSYFHSFPVTYNKYNSPLIEVKIGNNTYSLDVGIGTRFPLFLDQEILDQIDKQFHASTQWYDVNGQPHEAPSYRIPKMHIGDLTLTDIIAIQTLEKGDGKLGKYLGDEFNLFLDFPHSRIIACDSFSKMKAKGLADDDWVQVPFETSRAGVIFQVKTDLGMRKLSLNTTSTVTVLRPSVMPSKESLTSSTFCIGEREFGSVPFQFREITDLICEIDGFIGMDFLKKHAIYLDYAHKVAYIEPSQRYFERFPVTFGRSGVPTTNVHIEGNAYRLKIDLGWGFLFSLTPEVLQNIQKTDDGACRWKDFKGNDYRSPGYIVPEIKLGSLSLIDGFVNQDREDFHANVNLRGIPSQGMGSIGRPILEKYNLFLDFPHSAVYACDSHLRLQQAGVLSDHLLAIPFVLHPDGILLSVETDTGTLRLLLDTGCTLTSVRAPYPASTSKFCLMGHDFGPRSIMRFELFPDFEFDGCLGMDFLREYPLFIDYPNKRIFLDLQNQET